MITGDDIVSFFRGSTDSTVKGEATWQATIAAIQGGKYREQIEQARKIRGRDGEEPYREFKRTLPAVTFCGTFDGRRSKETVRTATGFIVADLDHLPSVDETFALIAEDELIWFAFRSPSGDGIKCGLLAEGIQCDDDIKRFYAAVSRYFKTTYALDIDPACKDICRLTYLSDDQGAYINESGYFFDIEQWVKESPRESTANSLTSCGESVGKEKYAQKVLESCCQEIRDSLPGNQHHTRLRMARLAGGYAHYMSESDVLAELEGAVRDSGAKNIGAAMKTVHDAFRMGTASPIEIPDIDKGCKANRARRSQQATNKEVEKAAAHIELARRVVTSYGLGNIRYTNSSFWIWAGGVWKRTDDRAVKLRIHEKCEKEIASQNTVNSVLEMCKTEVFGEDDSLHTEKRFVNCANGELHWTGKEWELRPHDRAHFSTSQIPVAYDPQGRVRQRGVNSGVLEVAIGQAALGGIWAGCASLGWVLSSAMATTCM